MNKENKVTRTLECPNCKKEVLAVSALDNAGEGKFKCPECNKSLGYVKSRTEFKSN